MSRRWLWTGVLLLAVPLFFVGPGLSSHRLVLAIWNDGHLPLFALLAWLGWDARALRRLSWPLRLTVLMVLMALVAGGIEWIQSFTGRRAEWRDVWMDLVGAGVGLGLVAAMRAPRAWQRRGAGLAALLVAGVALWPLAVTALDSFDAWRRFPVLSDFESWHETDRWLTWRARIRRDPDCAAAGEAGLYVRFLPARYAAVTLKDFPPDWRAYRFLSLQVFNPRDVPEAAELKIYDRAHRDGRGGYKDRFNRPLVLQPGWNPIRVALDEVRRAPARRDMDLARMRAVSLFLSDVRTARGLCLDDLRLE